MKQKNSLVLPIFLIFMMGFMASYILCSVFSEHLFTMNNYARNDYTIRVDGVKRDIRYAPHWDLIRLAWQDDRGRLLLNAWNTTNDRKKYYDWIHDSWEDVK